MLSGIGTYFWDKAYTKIFGHWLPASVSNLKWAMKQSEEEIVKYTFQEGQNNYSILEYAVICEDCDAVRRLLYDLNVPGKTADGNKSILAFFLDHNALPKTYLEEPGAEAHRDSSPSRDCGLAQVQENQWDPNVESEMYKLLVQHHGENFVMIDTADQDESDVCIIL